MQVKSLTTVSCLHPELVTPMHLKWKATFIEEFVPSEVATLRRAQSEPLLGGGACAEFSLERAYVETLEAEVDWLLALPRHLDVWTLEAEVDVKKPRASKRRNREAYASSSPSIASTETRCPSPTRGHPGDIPVFSSESTAAFGSESSKSPAACFGSERPQAPAPSKSRPPATPGLVGARPFCSEPPALASKASPLGTACSIGSLGHPQLCNRPCIQFSRGECAAGAACRFCHLAHGGRGGRAPHLDKRHREQLLRLPFAQRAAIALPIMARQVAKLGVQADAKGLMKAMEAAASPAPWDSKAPARREGASLISALGALSFHSLLTVISKAPDTPEWLKKGAFEEHMARIRAAEKLQGSVW